jgi:hypothetical protein
MLETVLSMMDYGSLPKIRHPSDRNKKKTDLDVLLIFRFSDG